MLTLIDCQDPRLTKTNKLCRQVASEVGVKSVKGGILLTPGQYFAKEKTATAILSTDDIMKLLKSGNVTVVCQSDLDDTALPAIGQRIPTTDRQLKIEEGWSDPGRTPEHKLETIEFALFGVEVTPNGILFTENSLIVVNDGAGRLSTLVRQMEAMLTDEETGEATATIVPKDRGFLWQCNFDLSGDRQRSHKTFLLHNRDAKRCAKGTTLCVENSLIDEFIQNGQVPSFKSCSEPLARTYVNRILYEKYDVSGSILELFPWRYEGAKSKSEKFRGKGNAASLNTALKDLSATLDGTGRSPENLPELLNFAFRMWHSGCQNALLDAHLAATKGSGEKYKSKYRLHSTLALKVMIFVSVRAFELSKMDEKLFKSTCERILNEHFRLYKDSSYVNSKSKKITMDRFWQECKWFCEERFNSGAVNTDKMIRELKNACDAVCGTQKTPDNKKRQEP